MGLMKTHSVFLTLSASLLLVGCASAQHGIVLAPVGPASVQATAAVPQGTLLVYSAYDVHAPSMGDFEDRHHYSDYRVFTEDGKLLEKVHNDTGKMMGDPTRVNLPPGAYHVVANANGYGVVTVPVVIAVNRTTTLHLEGGGSWPKGAPDPTDAVRLPDGRRVGWRADAETAANQ